MVGQILLPLLLLLQLELPAHVLLQLKVQPAIQTLLLLLLPSLALAATAVLAAGQPLACSSASRCYFAHQRGQQLLPSWGLAVDGLRWQQQHCCCCGAVAAVGEARQLMLTWF
jgi:hypothetical protein